MKSKKKKKRGEKSKENVNTSLCGRQLNRHEQNKADGPSTVSHQGA